MFKRSTTVLALLVILLINGHGVEPGGAAANLLKNGDFSAGAEFWDAEAGDIVPDPSNRSKKVLRLRLADGVCAASQKLSFRRGPLSLNFSCRLRAISASKRVPVLVRVRLYDENGNSVIIGDQQISQSERWQALTIRRVEPTESMRDKLLIEAITGKGALL